MRQKKAQFTVFRNVPASLVFEFTFLLSYYGNSVGETTGILQYPRVIISREQFLPRGLRKLGEEHIWRLQDEAAVQKGMLYTHLVEGWCWEELGETSAWPASLSCLHCHTGTQKRQGDPLAWSKLGDLRMGTEMAGEGTKGEMRDTQNTFFPLWSFFISVAIHWVLIMGINYTRHFMSIIEFNPQSRAMG